MKTLLHLFFLFIMALAFMKSQGGEDVSLKRALYLTAENPDEAARWGKFEIYEFPENDIVPFQGMRNVFFGNPLEFDFEKLPEGLDCEVLATFLSDTERTIALDVNGTEMESGLSLSKGKPVSHSWIIPSSRIYSGNLSLTITALSGPNAVLQTLEIRTATGSPLQPGKRKEFTEATDAELENLIVPFPIVSSRPVSIDGIENCQLSLNGTWQFSAQDDGVFRDIRVPGEWKMQGFDVPAGKSGIYKTSFDVPEDWRGKPVKLRFDAVHAVCQVEINGIDAGNHEGGFVPFELDVTKAVRTGKNELVMRIQSESVADTISCISQYAAHQVGGIIRKVTLFTVPETALSSEAITSAVHEDGSQATLAYEGYLDNNSSSKQQVTAFFTLKNDNGSQAAAHSITVLLDKGERRKIFFELPVDSPLLWTSETPNLYTLETILADEKNNRTRYSRKTGLRQVEIRGNQLFVNHKPVKLHAVNRHEVHPLLGRSLTPELCRQDAVLYKEANVNTIRTSHYPPSEEFLEACDELGLFVEAEAAVCWIEHHASPVWRRWNYRNPDYFPYFLRANFDMIAAYRNHPSIIMWSLANESKWSYLWSKTMDVVKRHEASRPILFHDQCFGGFNNAGSRADIANYHYPSESNPENWSKAGRPVWFGEYAHLQCYNRRELVTDPGIREDWGRPLQRMVDLIWEQPGCLGGAIWSGIDDVFHLPDGTLCGYGHWGPIDGWRREKPEYHGMRMAYSPLRILSTETGENGSLIVHLQNRHNFLNLNEGTLLWKSGDKNGTLTADISPHQKGRITLPVPGTEPVELILLSRQGKEAAREIISHDKAYEQTSTFFPLKYDEVKNQLVPRNLNSLPLPAPMVLALNNEGGNTGPAGSTLANEIEPYTPLSTWKWTLERKEQESYIFKGEGDLGTGTLTLTPVPNGQWLVSYSITVNDDVNPRQWGLVFSLPRGFDTLYWNRRAHWSWYPEDQIGRARGHARALPVARQFVEEPGVIPQNLWKDDSNSLGTNDFRSTKMNIHSARLCDADNNCFIVTPSDDSETPQSVRAWMDSGTVFLLVAGFNTGGADHFFRTHYSKEHKPLKKGETISSSFFIGISNPSQ